MQLITAPWLPIDLDTEEKKFVFGYYTLKTALYDRPNDTQFPHFITESENMFRSAVFADRIIKTPDDGMRLILQASILMSPRYGFNANGIWNHVLPTAQNLILP